MKTAIEEACGIVRRNQNGRVSHLRDEIARIQREAFIAGAVSARGGALNLAKMLDRTLSGQASFDDTREAKALVREHLGHESSCDHATWVY